MNNYRSVAGTLFVVWLALVTMSILKNFFNAFDVRMLEYRERVLTDQQCHEKKIYMVRPYICADIRVHPPSFVKTIVFIVSDTMLGFDKCGVPCNEVFTVQNMMVLGVLLYITGFRLIKDLFGKLNDLLGFN